MYIFNKNALRPPLGVAAHKLCNENSDGKRLMYRQSA